MAQSMTASVPLLRLRDVARRFDVAGKRSATAAKTAEKQVLTGIDLDLQPGEFVSLIGPSGAGKTTLLRLIAGLDTADRGERLYPGDVAPSMAMVFQEPRLVPWLTVLENLLLVGDATLEDRARRLLAEVELGGNAQSYPGQLSGGMQRRVALARALLVEPQILLLDEPLGSLDPALENRMMQLLGDYWQRHRPTVLMVTHDLHQAARLSSRILGLDPSLGRFVLNETLDPAQAGQRDEADCKVIVDHLLSLFPALAADSPASWGQG
ncbi:ABC transporter ATP-binding protein [Dongia soli]|uniref:ATP-binding cassette domain-containing protein n=1 Tax=Dongia soli TaxID=600628 RepID=A0ABU5EKU2_9PROT|nr:ATP-binding cassette domain-containing protein [Dongia soli]MDY0885815.1 ATP-binding cassette domain-containing protein [Dongia soli]